VSKSTHPHCHAFFLSPFPRKPPAATPMATPTRFLRTATQRLKPLHLLPPAARPQSTFTHLEKSLPERAIAPIFDDLSPQPNHRLSTTLADFLPSTPPPSVLPSTTTSPPPLLPLSHHLVYFEPTKPSSALLPDGTNPDQSPGEPFTRRMWAGGRVLYHPTRPLPLTGARAVCTEFIRRVTIKGMEGEEKIFVTIERRIALASQSEIEALAAAQADSDAKSTLDHRVRQRLWRDSDTDFGPCSLLETRNIVFMRGRTPAQAAADAAKTSSKILRPQHEPQWTHTIVPDAKLLFRFSALTFNAHAIHLDPQYAREVEGHRGLLFHGPLSYVFMMTLLQGVLAREGNEVVRSVEYRNLAPLYCHEPVTFCGARTGEGKWEIWTLTPQGGIAVKGTVVTGA